MLSACVLKIVLKDAEVFSGNKPRDESCLPASFCQLQLSGTWTPERPLLRGPFHRFSAPSRLLCFWNFLALGVLKSAGRLILLTQLG